MGVSHSSHTLSYALDKRQDPYDDSVNNSKENAKPRYLQPAPHCL